MAKHIGHFFSFEHECLPSGRLVINKLYPSVSSLSPTKEHGLLSYENDRVCFAVDVALSIKNVANPIIRLPSHGLVKHSCFLAKDA